MAYVNDLEWQRSFESFDDNERKVLLALSSDKYDWRTRPRVASVAGLGEEEADRVLAGLIERGLVRASISKKKNVIYGLRERVG